MFICTARSTCTQEIIREEQQLKVRVRKCQLVHLFYYSQVNTAEAWSVSYPLRAHSAGQNVNEQIRNENVSCGAAYMPPG